MLISIAVELADCIIRIFDTAGRYNIDLDQAAKFQNESIDYEEYTFDKLINIMHMKLSKALEEYRNHKGINEIYNNGEKFCGIPVELASCITIILNTLNSTLYDKSPYEIIREKMKYNQKRPYRHGGKAI